jgi:hypothetical protein
VTASVPVVEGADGSDKVFDSRGDATADSPAGDDAEEDLDNVPSES